jgi:ribosome-binding protein aMBF1 (putative translation factor)
MILGMDDLDRFIGDRTRTNPDFPALVEAARERRRLMRDLAAARRKAGLTQTAVAARMRTSEAAVSRLETGDADPRVSTVERYAAALGKRVEWRVVDGPSAA